ncbi:hypothetical protein NKV53_10370 [Legionella sp. 27cVA30]|uniref:Uncharacterized protein n=1 Tax=Legionella septentrionalis TaxID=2498109 RepID=A0A433JHE6_9GAMM|nr:MULTISPECIES: hypothetical protein [Legionella]MCP0914727.1 hypothetical protein [Legionella sp. 27cVA30]RUQ81735.1 hypothetical protein EKM59_09740 [Legionella septentrionalis]
MISDGNHDLIGPKEEKNNSFYTCAQISIKKPAARDFFICEALPQEPYPNSFVLLKKESWQLVHYNHAVQPAFLKPEQFADKTFLTVLERLSKANIEEIISAHFDTLRSALIATIRYEKFNRGIRVGIAHSNRGRLLYSSDFGPCQAVFARLKNEFALYHAVVMSEGDSLMGFVELIKQDVIDVFVVQKATVKSNATKAPYLAVALAKHLPGISVKRICVEDYRCIYLDAARDLIILSSNLVKDKQQATEIITSELTEHDLNNGIPVEQSVLDIFMNYEYEYRLIEENEEITVQFPAMSIPARLVIHAAKHFLKHTATQRSRNSLTFYKPVEDDVSLSLSDSLRIICGQEQKQEASCCSLL